MRATIQSIEKALDNKLVSARKENLQRLADIEHRLEFVATVDGVEYINDAKSTDVNSTWYSLDCLEGPVIWIASSCQFEEDYALLKEVDISNVKALIVLGEAKDEFVRRFDGRIELVTKVNTLTEAVSHAMIGSDKGDMVLFSPACSDYQNFRHYKEAGQQFRKAVREVQLINR
ncbi:MAG TPA: hypothetical protein DCX14_01295 [Flavobacteriales bacterium]|nr:hypothetical protein [Flavobacteriales bacterium]HAW18792.1 hypothetical protein [Flavobacteriales bacterium]